MGVLLLVRHGQASFGADDYDVLSEVGWEQGLTLGRWLAEHGPEPASVIHGGMRRHRETWEGIADGAGWSPSDAVRDARWAEFDHVAMLAHHAATTGDRLAPDADRRAFQTYFEAAADLWSAAPSASTTAPSASTTAPSASTTAPSASTGAPSAYPEPFVEFVVRARRALEAAAARPGPTLVVTSGGVIGALAALLVAPEGTALGPIWARFNTVIANTSVSRVVVGRGGTRLLTFNEHPHLAREQITYR